MVFSMRAEYQVDFDRFLALMKQDGCILEFTMRPDSDGLPDVEIEFVSDCTLGQIADVIRRVPDGHTMLQTLRSVPLADNSLKRNNEIH